MSKYIWETELRGWCNGCRGDVKVDPQTKRVYPHACTAVTSGPNGEWQCRAECPGTTASRLYEIERKYLK